MKDFLDTLFLLSQPVDKKTKDLELEGKDFNHKFIK